MANALAVIAGVLIVQERVLPSNQAAIYQVKRTYKVSKLGTVPAPSVPGFQWRLQAIM